MVLNINKLSRLFLAKEMTVKNTNPNQDVEDVLIVKFRDTLRRNKTCGTYFKRLE